MKVWRWMFAGLLVGFAWAGALNAQEIDVTPANLEDGLTEFSVSLTGDYGVLGDFFTLAPTVGHDVTSGRYWFAAGPRVNVGRVHVTAQIAHNYYGDAMEDHDGHDHATDATAFSALFTVGVRALGPFGFVVRVDAPLGADDALGLDDLIPTVGVFLRL